VSFEQGLEMTVDWYLENENWVKGVMSGAYKSYYREQYLNR
jgi:dTDP-glucose 4,6-dehydratase